MQTRINAAKQVAQYQWDSLHELAQWIDATPRTWKCDTSQNSEGFHAKQEWSLGVEYAQAVAMARDGWIEGAERAQEALQAFTPSTPEPDTKIDFYGFRPHVPRFCAGAPNCMIRHAPVATMGGGRVLTLIVPLFLSASTEARYAANFGVAVAQYVNQLETDGMRVEVIGCFVQRNEGWRTSQAFTVKHADQPLDLAVMAFAIGHPAMFRRIGFALQERSAAPQDTSYGYPEAAKLSDIINAPPGAVILDGMNKANSTARTPADALAYVSKQIEAAIAAQELGQ